MRFQLGSRRRRLSLHRALIATAVFTVVGLLILTLRSVDPSTQLLITTSKNVDAKPADTNLHSDAKPLKTCATVEEMGEVFSRGFSEESYRVRKIIESHFAINGASRVRALPPEEFCRHGFVLGKASEAGFGNEMYKILTAGALSVMLNRSLIIGQSRHIGSLSSLSICTVCCTCLVSDYIFVVSFLLSFNIELFQSTWASRNIDAGNN